LNSGQASIRASVLPKTISPADTTSGTERASVASGAVLPKKPIGLPAGQSGAKFLDLHVRITNLHGIARSTLSATNRRHDLTLALQHWSAVVQQVA